MWHQTNFASQQERDINLAKLLTFIILSNLMHKYATFNAEILHDNA